MCTCLSCSLVDGLSVCGGGTVWCMSYCVLLLPCVLKKWVGACSERPENLWGGADTSGSCSNVQEAKHSALVYFLGNWCALVICRSHVLSVDFSGSDLTLYRENC